MWHFRGKWIVQLVLIAFAVLSSWILGIRMRHRIKRALGINIENEAELTSLDTWIKVEDAEERIKEGKLQ